MDELDIAIADPRIDDVRQLVEHHLKFGRLHSPPQDAHALEVDNLLDPAVTLFSIRCRGELVAIGALKRFAQCEPFGDYRQSLNSTYMTMRVSGQAS